MAYKEMLKLVLVMAIEMDKLACTNMQLELQGSQPSCISGRNRWILSKGKKNKKTSHKLVNMVNWKPVQNDPGIVKCSFTADELSQIA